MDGSIFVDNNVFGELSQKFIKNNAINPAAFLGVTLQSCGYAFAVRCISVRILFTYVSKIVLPMRPWPLKSAIWPFCVPGCIKYPPRCFMIPRRAASRFASIDMGFLPLDGTFSAREGGAVTATASTAIIV